VERKPRVDADDNTSADSASMFEFGETPAVKADANPQVAAAVEAIRQKEHPERLSPLIAPPAFDRAAFQKDPQAYLATVEPGRVFQTAQPGPDIPQLSPLGPKMLRMEQGRSVQLEVQATPGAPVTFTSFDLGRFANELTSITVQASEEGAAKAEFFAPPGTLHDVNILAGSPEASGQVRFVVSVEPPRQVGPPAPE
jgi:hypothetical protein